MKINIRFIFFVALFLFALSVVLGSFYTVDQGERVVLLRNGAVIGTAEPGLHWKWPVIDRSVHISIQSQKAAYARMPAYSKDQQPADLQLSVNFRVKPDEVADIYGTYGSVSNLISRVLDPAVQKATKEVFGQYNAVSVIQERQKFGADVYQNILSTVGKKLNIETVQVENIDFSDAYEQSIEQRMLAEVEVQKVRQNLEKEKVAADIKRTQAQADADAKLAQATADAKAIALKGDAEARAIQAKGAALRDNPALVQLIQAERWNGKLPSTMVPGESVPFVSIK